MDHMFRKDGGVRRDLLIQSSERRKFAGIGKGQKKPFYCRPAGSFRG